MVTTTPNYGLNTPTVGGDVNLWGGYLNISVEALDALLGGDDPIEGVDINSGTMDGVLIGVDEPSQATFTQMTATNAVAPSYALTGASAELDPANGNVQTHDLVGATTYTEVMENGEFIILWVNATTFTVDVWPTMTWLNNGGNPPTLSTTTYSVMTLVKLGGVLYGVVNATGL